ncbi:MAG TPA: 4-hydroxybutyrate dehydrogenase [Afipia sp.]|uniref:Iron-containing alcohol dehydrogenase n=1 Tax=Candidatus Afipia apatlaquensis TaxID=2712852 RepID=A0A7C9RD83_9BRAD|nr:iron-containing alcohol dehydrogenase [Candidatus Afipia apatlaquensis]HAO39576.1 4-hydroxybutyrate dehydrogenase [Afipia sp.]HAP47324.1 4-hydroxybutyrate dehydrogenase [Afipia sp.]HBR44912.1 4-hydroxybutyrate dehydrogenase [Afipia sp.]
MKTESRSRDPNNGLITDACINRVTLINYVTRVHFGFGAIRELPNELVRLNFNRPLVVTDNGLFAGGISELITRMVPSGVVFTNTPSNPTEQSAKAAAALYVAEKCDGMVAIGGGSPMDLAKAAALLVTHDGPLTSYALAHGGLDRITANVPSIIAVPTTAGTGSEVARATVIITDRGSKLPIASPHLIPKTAICDPELTMNLPSQLTAATGFDALSHCVESFCSSIVNPPAEAIALDGMIRVVRFIERAVNDGSDREARWQMLMASLQGGLTFQKGLGAIHALSHPLGELGVHHGTLNAILLPHVLEFNRRQVGEKVEVISRALGLKDASSAPDFFRELAKRTRLPLTLSEVGVTESSVSQIAIKAEKDSCNATNPPPLTASEYEVIMRRALS